MAALISVFGVATTATAHQDASASNSTKNFAFRAKVVRERLEQLDKERSTPAELSDETKERRAQWLNFPNWPNWGNWNNWPNYWNNWGNYR